MSNNSEDMKPWKAEPQDGHDSSSPSPDTTTEAATRTQPWKQFMAAEKKEGSQRPWNGWVPSKDRPFDKPWLKWSVDFGVDNFRHMTAS
ncbi:hypothetical protein F5Y10DRAFT_244718 [Nemania abortiva]|nr:hypothetical protein F5Y10DRAFT_244718 [Nemania abortiva]